MPGRDSRTAAGSPGSTGQRTAIGMRVGSLEAAREVAVGALGTIYAIDGGDGAAAKIGQVLAGQWSLATALALLAWYVFAPQCASTLAVIRRETGSSYWMVVTFAYMITLAYVAALITYNVARAFGAG